MGTERVAIFMLPPPLRAPKALIDALTHTRSVQLYDEETDNAVDKTTGVVLGAGVIAVI